jgi:hypothetical protein
VRRGHSPGLKNKKWERSRFCTGCHEPVSQLDWKAREHPAILPRACQRARARLLEFEDEVFSRCLCFVEAIDAGVYPRCAGLGVHKDM